MKNNCKSAIFIVIITIILSGCSCFNSGQDDVGVSDIQEITVDNKNELYTYPNVYINGSFGEETYYYDWRQDSSAKKIQGERIASVYQGDKYFKLEDAIYSIEGDAIELKYKHNDSVQSILWADETSIVFTTENYEELPETKCTFWKYDLLADNITPIEEFYNVNSCIYNNYIIVVDNDWIIHFVNIDTLEDSEYDSNTKTGEMPDCFSIYKGKIIKNINDNSASYVLGYVESANNIDTFEAYKTKGFKYRKNVTNDKIVFYYVNDIDGRGEYKEGLSTPEHCDTNIWKWDEVELYDLQTEISQDIYKDETNRIIGYDYEENIVYLYSFSKNEIESKDLDDNSVTTLSSLEKAQTIKFTWCDKTLFWIYENDGIESYGGYLEL